MRKKETYTHKHWFLGKKHTHTEYKEGHAWVLDGYLTRRRKVDLMSGTSVVYSYYQYETLVPMRGVDSLRWSVQETAI